MSRRPARIASLVTLLLSACSSPATPTAEVVVITATPQQVVATTQVIPTNTPRPTPSPTPDPAQSELAALQADGYVPHADGRITHVDTLTYQLAQQSYSYWFPIEEISGEWQDYVVAADVTWQIASEKATWFWSGCGYFVRPRDNSGEFGYFVERTADGFVWLNLWDPQKPYLVDLLRPNLTWDDYFAMGRPGDVTGTVHMVLVLLGRTLRLLVDGDEVLFRDDIAERAGPVGVMVGSGTNERFGTRCTFSDLWFFSLDGVAGGSTT